MNREATELWSAALGAAGTVIRYGHWGRPVLVFPSERGRAWDFENNGMVDAVADLVDAGRVKLYCVDSYDAASWSDREHPARGAGPAARRVRVLDRRRRRAVDPRRLRRPAPRWSRSAAAWAPTTRPTSPSSAPTCSRWRCACPATTTRPPGTAGASRATRPTSTTPWPTSPACTVTTWTGCAARSACCWSCGQGKWEDTTGALAEHPAVRRAARGEGHPARAGRVGVRRPARLAVVARPARPPPAAILLRSRSERRSTGT